VGHQRRRSSTRDNPVLPGNVEYLRWRSSTRDNLGIPGNVEYPRRRSIIRDISLAVPGFAGYPRQRISTRVSILPAVGSHASNPRARRTSVALLTIPNSRLRRGSVQVQNFTKTRSNNITVKNIRHGSRTRKEKIFQVSCY
jgi:hypothetical protein